MKTITWKCDRCACSVERPADDYEESRQAPVGWIRLELFLGGIHKVAHFCEACGGQITKDIPALAWEKFDRHAGFGSSLPYAGYDPFVSK